MRARERSQEGVDIFFTVGQSKFKRCTRGEKFTKRSTALNTPGAVDRSGSLATHPRGWAHGFASPPYGGFAVSKMNSPSYLPLPQSLPAPCVAGVRHREATVDHRRRSVKYSCQIVRRFLRGQMFMPDRKGIAARSNFAWLATLKLLLAVGQDSNPDRFLLLSGLES